MASSNQANFHGHVDREVKRYLMTLLVDPAHFHTNARELIGRIMTTLSMDDATQSTRFGNSATETLRQMSIPGSIINALAPLWDVAEMAGYNPWRRFEEDREGKMRSWWRENLQVAKSRFRAGTLPKETWMYRYFAQVAAGVDGVDGSQRSKGCENQSLEQSAEEEEFAACMLNFQITIGIVTVTGPLQYFLMATGLHPEWQREMQDEIDRVCGDRMPEIGDYEKLPTVRACVKEALRWRSTVPLGNLDL